MGKMFASDRLYSNYGNLVELFANVSFAATTGVPSLVSGLGISAITQIASGSNIYIIQLADPYKELIDFTVKPVVPPLSSTSDLFSIPAASGAILLGHQTYGGIAAVNIASAAAVDYVTLSCNNKQRIMYEAMTLTSTSDSTVSYPGNGIANILMYADAYGKNPIAGNNLGTSSSINWYLHNGTTGTIARTSGSVITSGGTVYVCYDSYVTSQKYTAVAYNATPADSQWCVGNGANATDASLNNLCGVINNDAADTLGGGKDTSNGNGGCALASQLSFSAKWITVGGTVTGTPGSAATACESCALIYSSKPGVTITKGTSNSHIVITPSSGNLMLPGVVFAFTNGITPVLPVAQNLRISLVMDNS